MRHTGFFSDLDNTLIYSARHLLPDGPPVTGLELYPDMVGGYMTTRAYGLLGDIDKQTMFVPVTARHLTQWGRLQFGHLRLDNAVLCNGAVLLRSGARVAAWDAHIASVAAGAGTAPLTALQGAVEPLLRARGILYGVDVVEDLFCVYLLDAQPVPKNLLDELEPVGEHLGYRFSLQHRKLHVVPHWLSKADAMLALADELHLDHLLAAGDAVLDAPMVDAAEHGWVPLGGEIAADYIGSDHVTVTDGIGVLAGEQILAEVHQLLHRR